MGDGTILIVVIFIIGIEQVKFDTTYIHAPYTGIERTTGQVETDLKPFALLVQYWGDRNFGKVLRLILGFLVPEGRYFLSEITITVEQAHSCNLGSLVTGLLKVVPCQDTQAP